MRCSPDHYLDFMLCVLKKKKKLNLDCCLSNINFAESPLPLTGLLQSQKSVADLSARILGLCRTPVFLWLGPSAGSGQELFCGTVG